MCTNSINPNHHFSTSWNKETINCLREKKIFSPPHPQKEQTSSLVRLAWTRCTSAAPAGRGEKMRFIKLHWIVYISDDKLWGTSRLTRHQGKVVRLSQFVKARANYCTPFSANCIWDGDGEAHWQENVIFYVWQPNRAMYKY